MVQKLPLTSRLFKVPWTVSGTFFYSLDSCRHLIFTEFRLQLKCDGTRWRTGGEVKGKLENGVGRNTLYTTSEHGVSSITTADAHTSAASSPLNWGPRRFKWTRPFRRKTKSGFCACAITFSTVLYNCEIQPFKRRVKSHLPFAGIIRSSPYSPR
jgi:hypothetical protein